MKKALLLFVCLSFSFYAYAQKKAVVCTGETDITSMWELDPHEDIPAHLDDIRAQIYDTLYEFDKSGEPKESMVESCSVSSYSEDIETNAEMKILCKIRPAIFFHDGTELKSEDIVFSIKRIKTSRTLSATMNMIKDVQIVGQKDVLFTVKYNVGGIDSPNKWLFERFKRILAKHSYVGRKKYFEDAGSWAIEYPVGTGPFYFKDWKIWDSKNSRSQIILYKNKSYWTGASPSLDELYFRFVPRNLWADSLKTGALSLVYRMPYRDFKNLKDKDAEIGSYKKAKRLVYSYQYLLFSPYSKYLDNVDVKNAFLGGTNRVRLAKFSFGKDVMVNSGRSLYSSSVFPEKFEAVPYQPFDSRIRVEEYLKSVGAKKADKIPLRVLIPDTSEAVAVSTELIKQLYAAGFVLRAKKMPFSKYTAIVNKQDFKGYDLILYSMEENPVFATPQKLLLLANGGIQLYQRYSFYAMARPEKGGLKKFTPPVEGPIDLKDAE